MACAPSRRTRLVRCLAGCRGRTRRFSPRAPQPPQAAPSTSTLTTRCGASPATSGSERLRHHPSRRFHRQKGWWWVVLAAAAATAALLTPSRRRRSTKTSLGCCCAARAMAAELWPSRDGAPRALRLGCGAGGSRASSTPCMPWTASAAPRRPRRSSETCRAGALVTALVQVRLRGVGLMMVAAVRLAALLSSSMTAFASASARATRSPGCEL
mmetsp:Transcript_8864/g.31328  ORF Transcript_8864/g.31328 Transcript_8864/m.31328 type:complete len:213 (-) Transcript_8864:1477-2115(-)